MAEIEINKPQQIIRCYFQGYDREAKRYRFLKGSSLSLRVRSGSLEEAAKDITNKIRKIIEGTKIEEL